MGQCPDGKLFVRREGAATRRGDIRDDFSCCLDMFFGQRWGQVEERHWFCRAVFDHKHCIALGLDGIVDAHAPFLMNATLGHGMTEGRAVGQSAGKRLRIGVLHPQILRTGKAAAAFSSMSRRAASGMLARIGVRDQVIAASVLPKRVMSWKEAWEMYAESNGGALFKDLARYGIREPKGWKDACKGNAELLLGLNVVNGKVVYKGVSEAFNLPYTPVEQVF